MPGMSGLQATGAIRVLPGGGDVPILALTAQAMKGDRDRILDAGCDAYLAKPVRAGRAARHGDAPAGGAASDVLDSASVRRRRRAADAAQKGETRWRAYSSSITTPATGAWPRGARRPRAGAGAGRVDRGGAGAGRRGRPPVRAGVARQPGGVARVAPVVQRRPAARDVRRVRGRRLPAGARTAR